MPGIGLTKKIKKSTEAINLINPVGNLFDGNRLMENLLVGNIFVELALALLAGALLGILFFAGLWWTVNQLQSSQHVALLFIISLLVRSTIVIAGFYFIIGKDWHNLVAGLFGFMLVRLITTRYIQLKQHTHSLNNDLILDTEEDVL